MLTTDKLRVVIASSEAVPFFKTGGLADVSTALARILDSIGHDVTLIVPDYRQIRLAKQDQLPVITDTGLRFGITLNGLSLKGTVNWTVLPDSGVKVLLISQHYYFDRPELYMEQGQGYRDNCDRYCFFSRAVLEICQQMVLRPDVVHCNDWQTGLIPALLHSQYAYRPGFENAATVMTLHNMAYQGRFPDQSMPLTGMDWRYFNMHQMEMWGELNLLKTGIAFADQITTVSPTYADEICTPEGGEGLDGLLRHRRGDLKGILNGIDDQIWNPETDPHLAQTYTRKTVRVGKAACKRELQKTMGLPESDAPLLGMVSRMSDQKGFDLLAQCAGEVLSNDLQMVFLGTGDPRYQDYLTHLANEHPDKVAVRVGFSEALAHQIEAGADAFLMPSRFEPCGLNQMYSLRYGTLPIVRRVGGLADSVVDTNAQTLKSGTATGIVFNDYDAASLAKAIMRTVELYGEADKWAKVQQTGMAIDWSWKRSAQSYVEVYHTARERRGDRVADNRR